MNNFCTNYVHQYCGNESKNEDIAFNAQGRSPKITPKAWPKDSRRYGFWAPLCIVGTKKKGCFCQKTPQISTCMSKGCSKGIKWLCLRILKEICGTEAFVKGKKYRGKYRFSKHKVELRVNFGWPTTLGLNVNAHTGSVLLLLNSTQISRSTGIWL